MKWISAERTVEPWKAVVLGGSGAITAYFLLPQIGAKDVFYAVIGLGAVVSIVIGVIRHRPYASRSWLCLATGFFLFVLGDSVYDLYQYGLHRPTPFPSAADALYLAGYPFIAVGMVGITRPQLTAMRSRENYIDAAIVALGVMALLWHFLMGPYVHDPSVGTFGKLVNLSYPILDLAVFAVVVNGLVFGAARRPVHRILAIAFLAMVASDLTYDIMSRLGTYTTGDAVDAGWLVNYVLVGAAGLHTSSTADPEPEPRPHQGAPVRLPIVIIMGLITPAVLFALASTHGEDVTPLALISGLLFALIVLRMHLLVRDLHTQSRSLAESLSTRESLEIELRHQAFHDPLTGLANRALLHDRIGHAIDRIRRSGGSIGLCFCDLDGFKTVNDSMGHLAGDELLVAASKRIASVIRAGDTVARLGGDEFAILVEDMDDSTTTVALADRIVEVLGQPIEVGDRSVALSVSIGVTIGDHNATTGSLLTQADSAMYEAKAAGRGRYVLFEESMLDRSRERLELTSALPGALDREEFVIEYQPQFSLSTGDLEGFEALLRWHHPTLGVLAPDRFLAFAEQSGTIVPIGRWVIEQACEQAATWLHHGSRVSISVNLSERQLLDTDLVDDVRTALALSMLPPELLTLECSEHVIAKRQDTVLPILLALSQSGVRLSVDDFGTGYSTLNYLRQLPINTLKIHQTFVNPLADADSEGAAFVTTIVGLARRLGLATVAEGLEDPAQHEQLTMLGCDSAQGYLLSRPLTASAASRLVARERTPGKAFQDDFTDDEFERRELRDRSLVQDDPSRYTSST